MHGAPVLAYYKYRAKNTNMLEFIFLAKEEWQDNLVGFIRNLYIFGRSYELMAKQLKKK